ncbi:conserved hypothetical protein [Perkinsus marinus ATCC 50983]|uniref:RWD domain-containing protein n=1 Tax=Perkinsus marinus (strain ATCC 50983 / TXsc) TaxID=423536 RepID=C5KZW2_PERM5|nr:conserved hypothetical protein [Perkinsus marinus ATCC 50983]EER09820.1 conserved hypothetical protein [Perkinsus marinus ATCC 50983]|eukprot:XP_002778025.1 conserved hypothetical protein [Perkinsus marinus ATCC 50983]
MSGSCIALQLEEAEALRSVYGGEDGFMWLHEPDGDDDIAEPAYAVTVRRDGPMECSVTMMFTLPPEYPLNEYAVPEIVAVEGSESVQRKLRKIEDAVATSVRQQLKSGYDFPILASLGPPLTDLLADFEEEWIGMEIEREKEEAAEEMDNYAWATHLAIAAQKYEQRHGPPVLGRRMIYSHHIWSPTKRKYILEWARALRLGGMSKLGYPGCILIEGDERDCAEFVNLVTRLRWKYIAVRGEEQVPVLPGKCLDDMRALPLSFTEYGWDDMDKVAARCREAGLEELFLTCMKIYGGKKSKEKKPQTKSNDEKKKEKKKR